MVDPVPVSARPFAVRPTDAHDAAVVELADIFALLGDPGRLHLLTCLREAGELCVSDLAALTQRGESTVSHALRLLRAHRVVRVRRAGRNSYYSLADPHVQQLLDVGLEHIGHTVAIHPERT